MKLKILGLGLFLAFLFPVEGGARDAYAAWDSRCEECHGDADDFSRKYLWVIDGQLQGRHHIDGLRLFMSNHYVPQHEIDAIHDMLMAQANTLARFDSECSSCHLGAEAFVRKSIATGVAGMTGVESGMIVSEFLQTHRELSADDVAFFTRLITRVLDDISRP